MINNQAEDSSPRLSNPCCPVLPVTPCNVQMDSEHYRKYKRLELPTLQNHKPCQRLVVSTKNNVNVACRTTVGIFQTNFCKRCPCRVCRKKEIGRVVCNQPALTKTNWASDNNFVIVKYAANTERVLSFIFCAVRNFIVERAKTFCSMPVGIGTHVRCRKTENFCERMFYFHFNFQYNHFPIFPSASSVTP